MAVEVYRSEKQKEDPLDKLVKLSSIGIGIAGLAQKAKSDDGETAMDRRLAELKEPELGASAKNPRANRGYGLGIKY